MVPAAPDRETRSGESRGDGSICGSLTPPRLAAPARCTHETVRPASSLICWARAETHRYLPSPLPAAARPPLFQHAHLSSRLDKIIWSVLAQGVGDDCARGNMGRADSVYPHTSADGRSSARASPRHHRDSQGRVHHRSVSVPLTGPHLEAKWKERGWLTCPLPRSPPTCCGLWIARRARSRS